MITRICTIQGLKFTYKNVTFEKAAKLAVAEYMTRHGRSIGPYDSGTFHVYVEDPETKTTKMIKIAVSVEMKWTNPREGVDYGVCDIK